jgi:hypothetical protein
MTLPGASGAGRVVVLVWLVGCGPNVGEPSAVASESTTSGDTSTSTVTATSSPSTSESSVTQGSTDISSGETTIAVDVGGGSSSSSSESGDFDQCARCGPDEVCIHHLTDSCTPWALPCIAIPKECEVVTCDDPDCAQALCGDDFDCIGYGGPTCNAGEVSDGFVCASHFGFECDLWGQDCPDGDKCNALSDDNDVYDHTQCVPIARDPVDIGEPCTVEDYELSGIDDCAFGAQCLEVDPETLTGVCRALCTGSEANPSCEDPELTCVMNEHFYGWCVP